MRVCLSSCLRYPTGKSHIFCTTLYCQLWLVWLHHFFPTLSHKKLNIWKNITERKMSFDILYNYRPTHLSF
jgi:hypothetical protein